MEKYLPIGTVCTLNVTNRKYIIMGYFSIEYSSEIKMYDYVGVPYPEGMLLRNKTISFNHDDIVEVDFLGYSDENFQVFNNILTKQSSGVEAVEDDNELFSNFKFDENGIVVYEYELDHTNDSERLNANKFAFDAQIENPFNKKYNPSKKDNDLDEVTEKWTVFKEYKFDEEGNVITENDVEEQNDQYEFDENGVLIKSEDEE